MRIAIISVGVFVLLFFAAWGYVLGEQHGVRMQSVACGGAQ